MFFLEQTQKAAAKSLQSCPTLCDPIDGSPPGSPVRGIFHARVLEWGAIDKSIRSEVLHFKLPLTQINCLHKSLLPFNQSYIVTHTYVWAAYHIPQFISYLSKSCLPLVS